MVGEGTQALLLLGLGAVAVILGVFVLGPVLATPVMRVLGSPASHLSGATGRLAVENVKRNPKRTAATASALMIGVALVGFITILAASTKASVEKAVDDSFRADFVIDSGSWGQGGFETGLADQVAARPEVDVVSPFRTTSAEVDGAGPIRKFRSVTFPMLSSVIFFNLLLELINAFQVFASAYIISNGSGGPAGMTNFYTVYLYKRGFADLQMGYAAAMAWVLVIVVAIIAAILFKTQKSWVHYAGENR